MSNASGNGVQRDVVVFGSRRKVRGIKVSGICVHVDVLFSHTKATKETVLALSGKQPRRPGKGALRKFI